LLTLAVATLSTNIAANIVSPANDFSNLAPRQISFRTGGLIAASLGLLMQPWKLIADPTGYIFVWLIGYSALLGPIAGIMIADYFIVRRRQLDVAALYNPAGPHAGFHGPGFAALIFAVLPNLPGFLVTIKAVPAPSVPSVLVASYNYAWFIGFLLAFGLYLFFTQISPRRP
jgi:nucleobase:cation symporter-1, NCS1 family